MAWDAEKAIAEYNAGECDNVRCLNRKNTLVEKVDELRDAQALLKKIMQRAREHLADSQAAREIYVAIGNHNLGHRDLSSDLPREDHTAGEKPTAA